MSNQLTLSGDDYVLLMEALDAYITAGRDPAPSERYDYYDFKVLRAKLADGVGMNADDNARHWLSSILRLEREAFTAALTGKMFRLLEDRLLTRRTLRNEMVRAMQECRDFQFYKRGARLMPAHHATNPPPNL